MNEAALKFDDNECIGRILAVDTHRVFIAVESPALATRIGVGELIAIKGATQRDYLIAIVERVVRSLAQTMPDLSEGDGELEVTIAPQDQVRASLVGTYRTIDGSKPNTFKRGADTFPQIDREAYIIEGGNLQRFMGLLGEGFTAEERLKLGTFVADTTAEAIASGDKLFQRHAAILGSTGSGKSFAVTLLLERASKLNFPNIVLFDMHGEYLPLTQGEAPIGTAFKIAGPAEIESGNPSALYFPYWMLNNEEMISMIVDRSDNNAHNQASRVRFHVRELKEDTLSRIGESEILKTFTVDSPVPYDVAELVQRLNRDNEERVPGSSGREKDGPWAGKLPRLIGRLQSKLEDRRYGFMFSPPTDSGEFDWLSSQALRLMRSGGGHGIKIVDFSEVPSDVLPVVAGMLARLIYDLQFWMQPDHRSPITILCDEAHLYLPTKEDANSVERQALAAFERIAKEGRKYGVSIVVVSQRPSDISRTILSQCNNFIALRLTNEADQGVIRKLVPDQLSDLTAVLPLLDVGEALVLGDAVLLPARIKLDRPSIAPSSATRDFWREWSEREPIEAAIRSAVRSLRSQSRS